VRYAKVSLRLWNDQRFRNLGAPPPNAQFLFFYLMTSPLRTLIPGVNREDFSTVFQHFGWSARSGWAQVAALEEQRMVTHEDGLIWLPNALSHNRPANPNVVVGWRKTFDGELPECELRDQIGVGITLFLRDFDPPFRQAFAARRRAKGRRPPAADPEANGSPNGSPNGSGNGSLNAPRTVRRITSNSKIKRSVQTPAAGAAGSFWRVLRLAQAHLPDLKAEPTEGDRMEVLKTICAKHGILGYSGNLCGRVLSDARIAGQIGRR